MTNIISSPCPSERFIIRCDNKEDQHNGKIPPSECLIKSHQVRADPGKIRAAPTNGLRPEVPGIEPTYRKHICPWKSVLSRWKAGLFALNLSAFRATRNCVKPALTLNCGAGPRSMCEPLRTCARLSRKLLKSKQRVPRCPSPRLIAPAAGPSAARGI